MDIRRPRIFSGKLDQVTDVNGGMEGHGIDGNGYTRPPGMPGGGNSPRFVAQFHEQTPMYIAQEIGIGHIHDLSERDL